jgi:hypothetical protein
MIEPNLPRSGKGLIPAAVVCALLPCAEVEASSLTGIQDNGAGCVPMSSFATASTVRSVSAYYNNSTSAIEVMCPIVVPSVDSSENKTPISNVEVFYYGTTTPSCYFMYRGLNGSYYWSSALSSGTSDLTGTAVLKYTASFDGGDVPISRMLYCYLDPGEGIRGWVAAHEVMDIDTGDLGD